MNNQFLNTQNPMTFQPTEPYITRPMNAPMQISSDSLISFKLQEGSDATIIGDVLVDGQKVNVPMGDGAVINDFVYNEQGKGFTLIIKPNLERGEFRNFVVGTNPPNMLIPGQFVNVLTKKPDNLVPTSMPMTTPPMTTPPVMTQAPQNNANLPGLISGILGSELPNGYEQENQPFTKDYNQGNKRSITVPNPGGSPIKINVSYNNNNPVTINDYDESSTTRSVEDWVFDNGLIKGN